MIAKWTVVNTKIVDKQSAKPENKKILPILNLLFEDLAYKGPSQPEWPNYTKLKGKRGDHRHCHLQKGKPTYVCCWEVIDKKRKIIEVYYVGTHEKAPY